MKNNPIGQRIRQQMAGKGFTVEKLAGRTGLAKSFLEGLLQDNVSPSLGPLLKVSRALGVSLGGILDDHPKTDPLIVRRNQRAQKLSMLREKDSPVASKFYSLGTGKTDRHMDPFFVELLPESSKDKTLSSHEGEEFIIVYSGNVEIIYGDDVFQLESGDSVYYNSSVPHNVSCLGDQIATIYAVLFIPE
ncbi:Transcriptional regulator, MerR family [Olavius algarvensis associated proteobacterium Delta 3]|nr:Transcriptional regulator, MerR family [Olavius algarvensis associated proteobacterium Delta 3]CAB5145373.1 Transcriptional regulator, MerR family [Olavius algarvensis associated proteobacterium Delta 3]